MTDKEIIILYNSRSESAISETENKYGSYCKKIAMNVLQNYQDSEEVVNDSYLKAWNTIPPKEPNPFKTYIGMLTRTSALTRYEYYTAQKRNSKFDAILSEVENMIPSNQFSFEEGEITKAVNEFLIGLKKEVRIFFVRRYWYSDSISDIAELCGVTPSKVKSSLHRTRNALRVFLEKGGIQI